jgi:ribosome-associated translation inhibitor RaiA
MKTSLQFRNFDGFDHIKSFVEDSLDHSIGKFESWRHFDIHMVMSTVKGRTETHRPIFECELMLKGKGVKRPIIVKKMNSDFYQSVRSCLKATEKIFRRSSKIRVTDRRHVEIKTSTTETLAA